MAINPEKTPEVVALVEHENRTSPQITEHSVMRLGHVGKWIEWAQENRLEPTWNTIPQGKRSLAEADKPFKTEAKPINPGTGTTELKWKVWDDAKKMETNEVELYAVMRAEHHYISNGFTKLASKYVQSVGDMEVENCGVDSFFLNKTTRECVFCESKFTGNVSLFSKWKEKPHTVWQRLGRYSTSENRPCRQMSWEWIHDRASLAMARPAQFAKISSKEMPDFVGELLDLVRSAKKRRGKRIVNVFGAAQVPVYSGIYLFVAENAHPSVNELSIEWPILYDAKEFIELGQDFEDWLQRQPSHSSAPPDSPISS